MEVTQNTSSKMFLVASHLSEVVKSQKQLTATQAHNWKIVEQHLNILDDSTNVFNDCQQSLYIRTKILHQSIALSNVLSSTLTTIKTFRASIQSYKMNTLASFSAAIDRFIPLAWVPKQHLEAVLVSVEQHETAQNSSLHLAIPRSEILSYYETKILTAVRTNELGLMLVIAVPLSKRPVAMTVYRGHHVPMPMPNSTRAIRWKTETEYIAVARDRNEIALLTSQQLQNCIGSQSLAICYEVFPTITTRKTCMATLFFDTNDAALKVCNTEVSQLPLHEHASHLGSGNWLITSSAPNFLLREFKYNGTQTNATKTYDGCMSCIIKLPCDTYIEGPNTRLRPDLPSCTEAPVKRFFNELTPTLNALFALLPGIEQLPQFADISQAQSTLLHRVQGQLIHYSPNATNETLDVQAIAAPFIYEMEHLHPIHFKKSFLSTVYPYIAVIAMIVVALLVLYFYHKCCAPCTAHCCHKCLTNEDRVYQGIECREMDNLDAPAPMRYAVKDIFTPIQTDPTPTHTYSAVEIIKPLPRLPERPTDQVFQYGRDPYRSFVPGHPYTYISSRFNEYGRDPPAPPMCCPRDCDRDPSPTPDQKTCAGEDSTWDLVRNMLGEDFPPEYHSTPWKRYWARDGHRIPSKCVNKGYKRPPTLSRLR